MLASETETSRGMARVSKFSVKLADAVSNAISQAAKVRKFERCLSATLLCQTHLAHVLGDVPVCETELALRERREHL